METDKYYIGTDTCSNDNFSQSSYCIFKKLPDGNMEYIKSKSMNNKPYWLQKLIYRAEVLLMFCKYYPNVTIVKEKQEYNNE